MSYPALETDRLSIRPYRDEDAPRVLDIMSRIEVVRWLSTPPFRLMADLEEALAWVARRHDLEAQEPATIFRAIVPHETGVVAGSVLVAPLVRLDGGHVGEFELGWHLHPDSEGHGWATEAGAALARQAFDAGHDELVIDMYPDNHGSARVARRLGARDQGVGPDPWYGDEGLVFRLSADDRA